jgi:uncharacterized damage-inducible protein DinB
MLPMMTDLRSKDPRFPIGKFAYTPARNDEERQERIQSIATLPNQLRSLVQDASPEQLATPYREGGWTVRQVVHHVADSHINSYVRCKLALTENDPTIMTYEEAEWAKLPDNELPVEVSLRLLEALHERWTHLFQSLSPEQWQRTFRHPQMGSVNLDKTLALYAWHGEHHLAHVRSVMIRTDEE